MITDVDAASSSDESPQEQASADDVVVHEEQDPFDDGPVVSSYVDMTRTVRKCLSTLSFSV